MEHPRWLPLCAILALLLALPAALAMDSGALCGAGRDSLLVLSTSAGDVRIRLHEDAAPEALANFLGQTGQSGNDSGTGGQTIDYTRAHIEVRTSYAGSGGIPVQLDAAALGLTEQKITTSGDAMSVVQNELVVAYRRALKRGTTTPMLEDLLAAWFETYRADFLLGRTRAEINEALGYSYSGPLPSRPVVKGSVSLVPVSPTAASARLSIALADMPRRTGRWMVIGEVVAGLEIVDAISTAPLTTPAGTKPLNYQPLNPVAIEAVRHVCVDQPTHHQGEIQ